MSTEYSPLRDFYTAGSESKQRKITEGIYSRVHAKARRRQSLFKTFFPKTLKHSAHFHPIEGMEIISNHEPAPRFNPLDDYLFYRVMGEKGDEQQLLGFLNAVLGRSGKERIEYLDIIENTSFIKDIIDGKSCVLDLLTVLADGTRVNIEVQLRNEHNMDRRSLYYLSKVQSDSLKEGQDYRELPNVIAVNILDFDFPRGGRVHTRFRLQEETEPSLVLPALEIQFINMVQWRKLKGKDIRENPLHRWLAFLDKHSPPELVEEVAIMDETIIAAHKYWETADNEKVYSPEIIGKL